MYQCTRTESHDWASGEMWNVSKEVQTVCRHWTKLFMDRSTKGFEIIKMLFDNFSNPHTPFERKAPATQRHGLLPPPLACNRDARLPPKIPRPRMRHQAYLYDHNVAEMTASIFTSEKRKPSPGTNNQTPISLNFPARQIERGLEKLYHCHTEYGGNHLNGAGKTNQPQKDP